MQTIGKIINGKYVRYGAVSIGDKLGDAAFANIVNNATTTEEGFVPDARVVAQQQQIITQQQEQIDLLNSAIRNFALWSKTIPESGMSIADLPEGIYNLSSYGITSLTDLPSGFSSGRSIVITTGTASSSEKVIILASSRSGIIFYGTMYGSALSWKKINFTSL